MIQNFFRVAWRNIVRNKIYSIINIAGLSLGLACVMLIFLYTKDEVSFDRFHEKNDQIYRIVSKRYNDKGEAAGSGGFTGSFHGPAFADKIPEIKSFVRYQSGMVSVKKDNEVLTQVSLNVDSGFFSVFSFPLLHGNAATALSQPNQVVLSEEVARRFFGKTDVVGETLMLGEGETFKPYMVSAVAKNSPQNSSLKINLMMPIQVSAEDMTNRMNWFNFYLNTFVLLEKDVDIGLVEQKMKQVYDADAKDALVKMREQYDDKSSTIYHLQPLKDLHLNIDYGSGNGLAQSSNPSYSYILSGIALFILIIACINFINLTIARSIKRSKEIGIRKVVGSSRGQLVSQFMGESFLFSLFAFLLALLWVQLALPTFNNLSNKALSMQYLLDAKLIAGYFLLLCLTALLAGFYPALVLSSFDPVKTLYNRFRFGGSGFLQKGLVVLQFSLATMLIIGTITMYRQFNFLIQKPLGYNDANLISVSKSSYSPDEFTRFEQALKSHESIVDVTAHNDGFWSTGARINGDENILFAFETINEKYLPIMEIPIVEGRNFKTELASDSANSVLVNEAFVKVAGWEKPLEQELNFFWNNNRKYQVVGVVKDHHFEDLLRPIGPQVFTMNPDNSIGISLIRIKPGKDVEALKHIQATFKKLFPLSPYSYEFRVDQNREAYEVEEKWKVMFLFAALLTIFISAIGLFGLSVLNAEKRVKEVGVRKVLGATVSGIATRLSLDFVKLILISFSIAIPISYYAGHKWLQDYPYRISLGVGMFLFGAFIVFAIALLTISFQAIKAANANPVKSLRTE